MKLPLRKPTRMQTLLGLAGVSAMLAVAAQMSPRDSDADIVAPRDRQRAAGTVAPAARDTKPGHEMVAMLAPPDRADVKTDAAGNPFRSSNWAPPPPPPPKPVALPPPPPPPAPTAPPVPYRFVGKLEARNAAPRAFLAKGEALVIVSPGDTLDNLYKVESLGQTEVVLTYLPLNQRQTIPMTGGQ